MPLRAVLDQHDIQAFDYDEDSWGDFKSTYRSHELVTACCGHKAIPKTSSLGTQFFAHARRGDCTSAPESKEHLLAKTIVAKAARASGWHVTTEANGATPDSETWVADVLCQRGSSRIALEIQWSAQSLEDYRARQARYDRSGVRTAWLVKRIPKDPNRWGLDAASTFGLPMFALAATPEGLDFTVTRLGVPLRTFVADLLCGNLHFGPRAGVEYEVHGVLLHDTCWRCHRRTNLVGEVEIHHPKLGPLGRVYSVAYGIPELLQAVLTPQRCTQLGLGNVRSRYSRIVAGSYVSQGCAHCDALMGNFFLQRLTHGLRYALESRPGVALGRHKLTPEQVGFFYPRWRYAGRPDDTVEF